MIHDNEKEENKRNLLKFLILVPVIIGGVIGFLLILTLIPFGEDKSPVEQAILDEANNYIDTHYDGSARLRQYAQNADLEILGKGNNSRVEDLGVTSLDCFQFQTEDYFAMSGFILRYPENFIEIQLVPSEIVWNLADCEQYAEFQWTVR